MVPEQKTHMRRYFRQVALRAICVEGRWAVERKPEARNFLRRSCNSCCENNEPLNLTQSPSFPFSFILLQLGKIHRVGMIVAV